MYAEIWISIGSGAARAKDEMPAFMMVHVLQFPVVLGDSDQNSALFLNAVEHSSQGRGDIFVLPEMWISGFDYPRLKEYAARKDEFLAKLSASVKGDDIILSSLPEEVPGSDKVYNTTYAVGNKGIKAQYRKNFLFAPAREDLYFAHGSETVVFPHQGLTVGMLTCYEIRFPELFRQVSYAGADIIIVPAIWPAEKKEHWLTLTRARAIENQCYIIGGNCSEMRSPKKNIECGYSVAYDPWGEILFLGDKEDEELAATIEPQKVNEIREKIPSFTDAKQRYGTV